METNTLVSGKTVKLMEMVPKYGKMEENIQEILKMMNRTERELYFIPTEKNIKVNL